MTQVGEAIHVRKNTWYIPLGGEYWELNRDHIESTVRMIYDITSVHPSPLPVEDGKMMISERKGAVVLSCVVYEEDDGSKIRRSIVWMDPSVYRDWLSDIREMLQDALDLPLITYEDRGIVEKIEEKMKMHNFVGSWE